MTGILMFIHAVICAGLVLIILMQSGRGGGLTEQFASAESMFGAKTSEFLVRGTTILASIFLVTSLSLAVISARKDRSLMEGKVATAAKKAQAQSKESAENAAGQTLKLDLPEKPSGVTGEAAVTKGTFDAGQLPSENPPALPQPAQ